MKISLLTVLLIGISLIAIRDLKAQQLQPQCGWNQANQEIYQRNPVQRIITQGAHQQLAGSLRSLQTFDTDSLYTIPIVVHVIHTGDAIGSADNPTDANIIAMIGSLNDSWRKNGVQYGGVDMKMQFQLAIRSPQCGTTNGIERINGSTVPNYTTGGITNNGTVGSAPEEAVKSLSDWPNTDYVNIWIVNKIDGSATATGGYAYFAENNTAVNDGIVINAAFVNGTIKTIAHEMGHVFELYHPFYDDAFESTCPRTDSCAFYGDRVCDTEPCKLETDCSHTTNVCTGLAYVIADAALHYTVLNNYMNYTNCPLMFTQGQKDRARPTLFNFRPSLLNSGALTAPPGNAPATACIPTVTNAPSVYYGVERISLSTLQVYTNSAVADGASYVDHSCNQRTTLFKGQSYQLTMIGSYGNPIYAKIFIDYNNDGDFNDAGESIYSSSFVDTVVTTLDIPATGVQTGVPLRLRILADNPGTAGSDACHIVGEPSFGSGQIEDYGIIILNRQIISVASGPWTTPGTWSCNCVPTASDQVNIKAGHNVTVTAAMGLVQVGKVVVENGGNLNVGGTFKITAN